MMVNSPTLILFQLLREAPLYKVLGLCFLMLATALTEGVSIIMLVPMLSALSGSMLPQMFAGYSFGFSNSITVILVIFVALVSIRALLVYTQTIAGLHLQSSIIDNLREACFRALITAEWRWLAQQRSSDHASLLISNISRVGYALNQVMILFGTLLIAIACLGAAFILSWQIALIATLAGIVFLFGFTEHKRRALILGHDLGSAHRAMHAHVQEGLAGVRLTKILGNEDRTCREFSSVLTNLRSQTRQHTSSVGKARIASQVGGALLMAVIVYSAITVWYIPIPRLLPALIIFARFAPMLERMQQAWHYWLHAVPALIETRALYAEADSQNEDTCFEKGWQLQGAISLENVCFAYGDQKKQALAGISLTLRAQTTTAIIGVSGSGKSSLADIIMGLITPQSGKILIDGRELSGGGRQSWRHSVAYVQQDVFLFYGTIRANMIMARYSAKDDELISALQSASADFVLSLPNGLDTVVGDGGIRLSGGERQRIALARALLGNPQLLILDEATSALDQGNEVAIRKAIAALHGNLTLLIIGHRLSMIDNADQVIHVNDGRITEIKIPAINDVNNFSC